MENGKICPKCYGRECTKNGIVKNKQRYRCKRCKYNFTLYFFLPLLNEGIKSMTKKEMEKFNLSLFLLFSCFNQIKNYSSILTKDFFHLINGFTYIWLIILYFYGSYFGKFNLESKNCNKYLLFIIISVISCIASFLRNLLIIYLILLEQKCY